MNKSLIKVLSIAGGIALAVIAVAYVQSRTPVSFPGLAPGNTSTPTAASQPLPSPAAVAPNQSTDPQVKTAVDAVMATNAEQAALTQDDETAILTNDEQNLNAFARAYDENNL